ncbi:uncharacterized protein LOC114256069 [Camellia sinensis]|uniref:uncharacterized protein LOC114256069 n=1 Tax=Camellia sinensis TaxID=4442 RepID=UPI0010364A97|nr:uncharacterized protein LOC114256069 [Camellia sinensis]
MQAFSIKKELADKTKEARSLQKTINKAKAKMKTLINQAEEAKKAQDEAKERVGAAEAIAKVLEAEKKEAEAKAAEAQVKLIAALATKEAEVKAVDEKAYDEEDEVPKDASPQKTNSEVPIAEKSLDQTLQEIDAKLETEKATEKSPQLSSGAETQSAADAE